MINRIFIFFIFFVLGCSKDTHKMGQSNAFIKFYGGFIESPASHLALNKNGGYGIVGTYGTVKNKNQIYVINTDEKGITQWQKIIGGKGNDAGKDLKIDNDGNFIVFADSSYSSNSIIDSTIFYLVKISPQGNVLWSKAYGSNTRIQQSQSLLIVSDGYIMMGNSLVGSNQEILLIKTDFDGKFLWQKPYDVKSLPDVITSIQPTFDNNFIWSGGENRYRGPGPTPTNFHSNARVTNITQAGDILFDRTYLSITTQSYGDNIANEIKTINGGYIIIGTASVSSGAPTENKDIFVLSIFNDGSVNWSKTYGSSTSNDYGQSIALANDGGFYICGKTNTTNNKYDVYLNKIDGNGNSLWNLPKTFGGINDDYGQSVLQAQDGGVVILATINYSNIPVLSLIKTNSMGELKK